MKIWLEQRRQAMFHLHLSEQHFIAYWGEAYIRGLVYYQLIHWPQGDVGVILQG